NGRIPWAFQRLTTGQVGTTSALGTGTNWLDTWLPLICQISAAPLSFNHSRSLLPSAVKSATVAKCHSDPSCAAGVNMREMAPSVVSQIWTSLLLLTQTTSVEPVVLETADASTPPLRSHLPDGNHGCRLNSLQCPTLHISGSVFPQQPI